MKHTSNFKSPSRSSLVSYIYIYVYRCIYIYIHIYIYIFTVYHIVSPWFPHRWLDPTPDASDAAIAHWATGFPRLRWSEWRPTALGIPQRPEASAPPPGPEKNGRLATNSGDETCIFVGECGIAYAKSTMKQSKSLDVCICQNESPVVLLGNIHICHG